MKATEERALQTLCGCRLSGPLGIGAVTAEGIALNQIHGQLYAIVHCPLHAAAPALLAALERAERVFRIPHGHLCGYVEAEVLMMMRAAIRQAKGEAS